MERMQPYAEKMLLAYVICMNAVYMNALDKTTGSLDNVWAFRNNTTNICGKIENNFYYTLRQDNFPDIMFTRNFPHHGDIVLKSRSRRYVKEDVHFSTGLHQ